MGEYVLILKRFFGFYVVLEPLIRRPVASQRLQRDLQDLGLSEVQIQALPRYEAPPDLPTESARIGAAYVLEGAAAGGRIMAEGLARATAGAPVPVRFLSGDNDDRQHWRKFTELLEAALTDPADRQVAAAAAQATFLALEFWMKDWDQYHG